MQSILNETSQAWRVVILDSSGLYTQIYDEVYGNGGKSLQELFDIYSNRKGFSCFILEG